MIDRLHFGVGTSPAPLARPMSDAVRIWSTKYWRSSSRSTSACAYTWVRQSDGCLNSAPRKVKSPNMLSAKANKTNGLLALSSTVKSDLTFPLKGLIISNAFLKEHCDKYLQNWGMMAINSSNFCTLSPPLLICKRFIRRKIRWAGRGLFTQCPE